MADPAVLASDPVKNWLDEIERQFWIVWDEPQLSKRGSEFYPALAR